MALNAGDRVQKIVLCNPSAKIGTAQSWNDRIDLVKNEGLEKIAENTAEKWFTDDFINNEAAQVQEILENFKKNSPQGYASCCVIIILIEKPNDGFMASIDRFLSVLVGCTIGLLVVIFSGSLIKFLHKKMLNVERGINHE
ncbi:hypothetical protein EIB71_10905 [Kaistella daneshvariae]|uniref:Uncharacterized protein n=1 Tax=Kaistella daneshvariae TaxID=2487074 RepID=A0ABM7CAV4_9FLAO|nr:hypothetical protein [Kaistella daneshvariae]AZI68145.1 hypothetical protein EIB71_10905 [Kaistella daneshvariae]